MLAYINIMLLKLHGDSSDIRVRSFVCPTASHGENAGRENQSDILNDNKIWLVVSNIFMFHDIWDNHEYAIENDHL
jgi:hypothetical protein